MHTRGLGAASFSHLAQSAPEVLTGLVARAVELDGRSSYPLFVAGGVFADEQTLRVLVLSCGFYAGTASSCS